VQIDALAELLFRKRAAVLTGAGCSTESGIPDYRGPETRDKPRRPVQFQEFVKRPEARKRYWARSTLGWPKFRAATPNAGHRALAQLESAGLVEGLITQNVDRLHHKAGSREVIELHGNLGETRCLGCGLRDSRDAFQARILGLNPGFANETGTIAPDGDVDVEDAALDRFVVPPCSACGGVLKPDVVLFGESVPAPRVERAFAQVDKADLLLVVGSSLTVYSGYRFAVRARERGIPLAIVNLGETRADALATHRLEERSGAALSRLAALLA
jgi:NAD-dependent deacetylase sirtuin 4